MMGGAAKTPIGKGAIGLGLGAGGLHAGADAVTAFNSPTSDPGGAKKYWDQTRGQTAAANVPRKYQQLDTIDPAFRNPQHASHVDTWTPWGSWQRPTLGSLTNTPRRFLRNPVQESMAWYNGNPGTYNPVKYKNTKTPGDPTYNELGNRTLQQTREVQELPTWGGTASKSRAKYLEDLKNQADIEHQEALKEMADGYKPVQDAAEAHHLDPSMFPDFWEPDYEARNEAHRNFGTPQPAEPESEEPSAADAARDSLEAMRRRQRLRSQASNSWNGRY